MFAMVLLTATVLVIMFRSRVRAIREKALTSAYFRILSGRHEPEYAVKPARHFINLFEAPTLFYAACLAGSSTQTADRPAMLDVSLGLRRRTDGPRLDSHRPQSSPPPDPVYAASWAVLLALWICIVVEVARAS